MHDVSKTKAKCRAYCEEWQDTTRQKQHIIK